MKNNHKQILGQKYRWLIPEIDNSLIDEIVNNFGISKIIALFLVSRGKINSADVKSFLYSSIEDVPHASLLKDCNKAVNRIKQAIENKEKILIVGDYDVDGITSTSMLMTCLPLLGANVNFFLPNRLKDGYGLSVKI